MSDKENKVKGCVRPEESWTNYGCGDCGDYANNNGCRGPRGEDGKLHGDVSEEVKAKWSSYYTSVPGGVGPMTIAMLMRNVFRAYTIANGINGSKC